MSVRTKGNADPSGEENQMTSSPSPLMAANAVKASPAGSASTPSRNLNPRMCDIFNKVFHALHHLSPQSEILIAVAPPLASDCQVSWATEGLKSLLGKTLPLHEGPLTSLTKFSETSTVLNSAALGELSREFASIPEGRAAVVWLDLAGDGDAFLLYWLPVSGEISEEKLSALAHFAQLATLAASAADLSEDVRTHQKQLDAMREELAEVQQFYRHYSESISQCFWVLDIQTSEVLVVSDNFERIWGAGQEILRDGLTGFMATVIPEDRDRVLAEFHIQLGSQFNTELRTVDRQGEVRWLWLRVFPTHERSASGQTKRIVIIADDITEKKQQEELLRSREARLAASAKSLAVGDLASGVAHEINNPLTVIVGKAAELRRMVERKTFDPNTALLLADKIQETSIRISNIISSLKSLGRANKDLAMAPTPLAQVFQDVLDVCSERFKNHQVKLEVHPPPRSLLAEMNLTLASQMVLNLVNNAFDAVSGHSERWVDVDYAEDEKSVFIYVTDSGSGIPIIHRNRIFDPFFTTKGPRKGTGLGLSLASGIATRHGGTLRLDTLFPRTRFVVQLPKQQARKAAA